MDAKQYALFAGETYDTQGGWGDFVLAGTLDECKSRLRSWGDYAPIGEMRGFEWAHIVDLAQMQVVWIADGDTTGAVVWVPPSEDREWR